MRNCGLHQKTLTYLLSSHHKETKPIVWLTRFYMLDTLKRVLPRIITQHFTWQLRLAKPNFQGEGKSNPRYCFPYTFEGSELRYLDEASVWVGMGSRFFFSCQHLECFSSHLSCFYGQVVIVLGAFPIMKSCLTISSRNLDNSFSEFFCLKREQ